MILHSVSDRRLFTEQCCRIHLTCIKYRCMFCGVDRLPELLTLLPREGCLVYTAHWAVNPFTSSIGHFQQQHTLYITSRTRLDIIRDEVDTIAGLMCVSSADVQSTYALSCTEPSLWIFSSAAHLVGVHRFYASDIHTAIHCNAT